jgi:hypothetical protein
VIFEGRYSQRGMKRSAVIIIVTAIVLIGSCKPIESLPDEPAIEFRTFALSDIIDTLGNPAKSGKLTFYFEDGDGDLGLDAPEDGSIDPSGNLFFQLYRKNGNSFELAGPTDPLYPSEYRIPVLEAEGQNKILRGTIDVTMTYYLYNTTDTLYYDFWIRDRGGNDSNTASTCIFILGENGTCGSE